MSLNIDRSRDFVNDYNQKSEKDQVKSYPLYFSKIILEKFRHVSNLSVEFKNPITVITGCNRTGKTSVLLAVACSHYNFQQKDITKGEYGRITWGEMMRFTSNDKQTDDWSYHVFYREGDKKQDKFGYRKQKTMKWAGVAKKESQIGTPSPKKPEGGRHVRFIDLNRIVPSRHLRDYVYAKARKKTVSGLVCGTKLNEYLSYILEMNYDVKSVTTVGDSTILSFNNIFAYSSYNTASGEDVLANMLIEVLEAPKNSLILIDEIEVGLHPKIQRKIMDVLYDISNSEQKQFIITTHSYAILDSVKRESRVFLSENSESIANINLYRALTKMDSFRFPVVKLFVEDDLSKKIINKALNDLNSVQKGISNLFNISIIGSADKTYGYFTLTKQIEGDSNVQIACILDGDMRSSYGEHENLFYHYSDEAPEKMLLRQYLKDNPNVMLDYHLKNSNPHCLLFKMVEVGVASDYESAFNQCFEFYKNSDEGGAHYELLKDFLKGLVEN